MATMYTQVPRAVMWLIKGDDAVLGTADEQLSVELGSFYISRGCITNEQFEAYRPQYVRAESSPGDDDPAVNVSFRDAVGYAQWYADLAKKPFRLPTELEWEMAARSAGRARYPWGDRPEDGAPYARTLDNSGGHCHPVDQIRPSKLGLYGMIGNCWEWTSSRARPFATALDPDHDDLTVQAERVIRGGGFQDPVAELSCDRRDAVSEQTSRTDLGFRIVRSL